MSIFRVIKDPDNPYVMINKTMLNNKTLSWKAKGLLAYMLSMPDDWQFYERELTTHSKDGRSSTRSAIRELTEHGYVVKRGQAKNNDGTWGHFIYDVYEIPVVQFSNHGESDRGKSNTTNNDYNNNDVNNISTSFCENDEFISFLNKYCYDRFGKPLRKSNNIHQFDTASYIDHDDLIEYLDEDIKTYDQCNPDYIETIQDRWR